MLYYRIIYRETVMKANILGQTGSTATLMNPLAASLTFW